MGKQCFSPSNATRHIVLLAGTTSMLLLTQPHTHDMVPSQFYSHDYHYNSEQPYMLDSYLYRLKHELMPGALLEGNAEPLVDMPIFKSINVVLNKPEPLEFTSVENDRGFIE